MDVISVLGKVAGTYLLLYGFLLVIVTFCDFEGHTALMHSASSPIPYMVPFAVLFVGLLCVISPEYGWVGLFTIPGMHLVNRVFFR